MATIELASKYASLVDEKFTTESKSALLTNQDYDWIGVKTVQVYKISTSEMNDYDRGLEGKYSKSYYGEVKTLDATTQEMTLSRDRSFTFVIDRLDDEETGDALGAAKALERQLREVAIPEFDEYTLNKICTEAGIKPKAKALTVDNIATEILTATNALDNKEVPESGRILVVTPDTYFLMKQSKDIVMNTDIGNDMRIKGVISSLDGMQVLKVPASRLPKNFGFMVVHPVATVCPRKLNDYKIHDNPPGINGFLVEGRLCYDAFVLDNKKEAIYYQPITASTGA